MPCAAKSPTPINQLGHKRTSNSAITSVRPPSFTDGRPSSQTPLLVRPGQLSLHADFTGLPPLLTAAAVEVLLLPALPLLPPSMLLLLLLPAVSWPLLLLLAASAILLLLLPSLLLAEPPCDAVGICRVSTAADAACAWHADLPRK